jgi:hypothetical protein
VDNFGEVLGNGHQVGSGSENARSTQVCVTQTGLPVRVLT